MDETAFALPIIFIVLGTPLGGDKTHHHPDAVIQVLLDHIEQHRVGPMPFQRIDHLWFTDVPVIATTIRSVDQDTFSTGQR